MKVFEQPYFSEVPSFFLVFNEAVKSQGSKKELYMKICRITPSYYRRSFIQEAASHLSSPLGEEEEENNT